MSMGSVGIHVESSSKNGGGASFFFIYFVQFFPTVVFFPGNPSLNLNNQYILKIEK